MQDQVICPNCKKSIPLTQALSHQIQEKYRAAWQENMKKKEEEFEKKLQEERLHLERTAREKIQKELELKMADTKNESEELRKQNQGLQEQLLELNKLIRQLRTENETGRLELEKKLSEEQDKIRAEEQKRLEENYRLKTLEQEKKLHDALQMNQDLKRKLEQGSQQTQGEVLELELEQMLSREFPTDEIQPVAKGVRGGDILQIVKSRSGQRCGTIIWETKRTKAWSNEWISKLKEDQRNAHAELAVLISEVLPNGIKHVGVVEGVWVADYDSALGIAISLHSQLSEIALVRQSAVGKNEKMEVLYNYLTGTEFRHRVEAIVESFSSMQEHLEKEKRWFNSKWAKEERMLRMVLDNTIGMHGDLQSIMGKALGELPSLELLPEPNTNASTPDIFEVQS
ncbi:DUF2130 domain-containing protein [Candidatus Roizmanbacteria bacterium]|nr:DUF2130 domain-containing protein [Candidatus Roizmanbacteria bacterium]